jgi:hypothetical protein
LSLFADVQSQMLRAAATVAPRAVFVCANTSTAAGLTVSVSRDASSMGGRGKGCREKNSSLLFVATIDTTIVATIVASIVATIVVTAVCVRQSC